MSEFEAGFIHISELRKTRLLLLSHFIEAKIKSRTPANLNFICTHNSRRSHIAQVWAQAAALHYELNNIHCFSGGTEATAVNPRAVTALTKVGFQIVATNSTANPRYEAHYANHAPPLILFSKVYSDAFNPTQFAAIMTCAQADESCPVVAGAEKRISLPYNDPKDFDGTPQEEEKYTERVLEIGREICFAFSKVNTRSR
ncbi:MAG: protein-tyrosine-phosphatase [Cyclobacteriaceae bacterium]|nr:protein-tyrosine-phosphatase [Cyclobacteriaceae bacterium]